MGQYSVYEVLGVCSTRYVQYWVYPVHGRCSTRYIQYTVDAVHGVSSTRCMQYSVSSLLSVCCVQCLLMIMTWRYREKWLNFVFLGDARVEDEKQSAERDGGNHHEKLRPERFPSVTQYIIPDVAEWLPLWLIEIPIQWLLNPIWQVVPVISHILTYSSYPSHLHPTSLVVVHYSMILAQYKVLSFLSISPCHEHQSTLSTAYPKYSIHQVQQTPSTAYTKYSIHQVQHTPSTTYTKYNTYWVQHSLSTAHTEYSIHLVQHTQSIESTQDYLSSSHSHNYRSTSEWYLSFHCVSLQDQPPPASSPLELKENVTSSHSPSWVLTNWGIESRHLVCLCWTFSRLTATNCSSNLTQSWPLGGSPNSPDSSL